MIPVTQTKVMVKNSAGLTVQCGNCWAAAIASILEFPLTEVPNFEVWYCHTVNGRFMEDDFIWDKLTERFLNRLGYTVEYDNRFQVFHVSEEKWNTEEIPGWDQPFLAYGDYTQLREALRNEYYFISGPSPRGVSHVTIWQGDKMMHDPHPSREGILEKNQFQFIRPLTAEEKANADDYYNHAPVPFPSIRKTTCK